MNKPLGVIVLIGLAILALVAVIPRERHDLAAPEDTAFLWDGLYLGHHSFADVPYVATPYDVVDAMVRLAGVRADDVVYDLGCGDGRLVIEAARRTGCRGVGVDIDANLIALSRKNAAALGVEDRVRFVQQDFFETDIREATVMLVYLFTGVNVRLRPKFLNQMKPGSRLVSNTFDMGDWEPDLKARAGSRQVLLWVVPANVAGTWTWRVPGEAGGSTLRIEQRFQHIRGALSRAGTRAELSGARISGNRIGFSIEQEAGGVRKNFAFEGTVEGDQITGTLLSVQDTGTRTIPWKALRDPATRRPLDTGHPKTERHWP